LPHPKPSSPPLLSVIVPVHGNLEETRACLESLDRQEKDFPLEIVVADSGSPPPTAAWLASRPGIRLVRLEENLGFPRAANAGAAAARGHLLLFLNNDTLLPRKTLQGMVDAWRGQEGVGALGPSSDRVKGDQRIAVPPLEGDPGRLEELASRLRRDYAGKVEDVPQVMGLALLVEASLWRELGGFDERFGLGNFEDDDLCLRIRGRGCRILVARDTFVHHAGMKTFQALGVDYQALVRENQARFLEKWRDHPVLGGKLLLDSGRPGQALGVLHQALLRGFPDPELFHLLGTALYLEGRPAEAVQSFDRLLRVAPRHTTGAFLRALALMDLGREREAREATAALLTDFYLSDTAAARLLASFAEACLGWGRPTEAEEHFGTALSLDPACTQALTGLASLALEQDRKEEARRLLDQAGQVPLALAMKGAMEWEEGRPEGALSHFLRALHLDPRHAPSLSALFSLASGREDLARALEELGGETGEEEFLLAARKVREGALREAKDVLLAGRRAPGGINPAFP